MFRRFGIVALCWAHLAVSSQLPQLLSTTVDLRKWGYSTPTLMASYGEFYSPSHLLSFSQNGDVLAGFVTRDTNDLATRDRSALVLHVVAFNRKGGFLWRASFPTTMRDDNGIWGVGAANLIVRTPEALSVCSRDREVLAAKISVDPHAYVKVSPNRQRLLVLSSVQDKQLLLSNTLTVLKSCPYHEHAITSIQDDVVLRFLRGESPWSVRVQEVCGPTHFDYSWTGPIGTAVLLDKSRFLIYSHSGIKVVDRDRPVWSDSFKKGETIQEVESDEKGGHIAVAIAKYVGGSQFLDVNGRLKVMKVVVYKSADRKRIAELVVEHPPRLPFNFLGLSPDGSVLAILSNGFLQIAQLSPSGP